MQHALYNIAISLYGLGIRVAALFNPKANLWVQGRKSIPVFAQSNGKRVWVHCSSLGEFEQARPLIEAIKKEHPQCYLVLSFFSPSGYEVRQNYTLADKVVYLPLDTPANAAAFIDALQPNLVLWTKYDFWHNILTRLKQRGTPVILFSAIFRPQQVFFKWYGGFFRHTLKCFSKIYVQNNASVQLLRSIQVNAEVAPDTRFDRVAHIARQATANPLITSFKGTSKLLIAGSTWPQDEELITQCLEEDILKEYKYVIAPHQFTQAHLTEIKNSMKVKVLLYSELTPQNAPTADVVIIDNFGMLASLYSQGEIAYVGGGFNASVHNVLEAAVYGIPVVFGPNHTKAEEALQLINAGGAFAVSNLSQIRKILEQLAVPENNIAAGRAAQQYTLTNTGGTDVIYRHILPYLQPTG